MRIKVIVIFNEIICHESASIVKTCWVNYKSKHLQYNILSIPVSPEEINSQYKRNNTQSNLSWSAKVHFIISRITWHMSSGFCIQIWKFEITMTIISVMRHVTCDICGLSFNLTQYYPAVRPVPNELPVGGPQWGQPSQTISLTQRGCSYREVLLKRHFCQYSQPPARTIKSIRARGVHESFQIEPR